MEDNLKILLCEDDENLGMLLREYLAAKGYEAELCPDGDAGYKAFLKTGILYEHNLVAERLFHLLDNVVEINIVRVELVDGKNDRLAYFVCSTEDVLCTNFNAVLSVDKEDARVGYVERCDGVANKVVAARAVDEVDFLIQKFCVADCRKNGVAIFLLYRKIVAHRVAVFYSSSTFYNSTLVKHCFGECGFPGALTTNEGDVFDFVSFVNFHCVLEILNC